VVRVFIGRTIMVETQACFVGFASDFVFSSFFFPRELVLKEKKTVKKKIIARKKKMQILYYFFVETEAYGE
jgi:hypothetical protein